MKNLIILFFYLPYLSSHSQEVKTEIDWHKWEAPYYLPIPKDWGVERFPLPISFAPQIAYKGVEDIRFAPGWAKKESDEYWTYAFLWYLDSSVKTNKKIIAENLKNYYTGLFKVNTDSTKTAAIKVVPVTTSFKKATKENDDIATFSGTIEMMDYLQLKPITLYCIAHLKSCPDDNKTIVFYELSPKPFTHNNWTSLSQLWQNFRCKK